MLCSHHLWTLCRALAVLSHQHPCQGPLMPVCILQLCNPRFCVPWCSLCCFAVPLMVSAWEINPNRRKVLPSPVSTRKEPCEERAPPCAANRQREGKLPLKSYLGYGTDSLWGKRKLPLSGFTVDPMYAARSSQLWTESEPGSMHPVCLGSSSVLTGGRNQAP